MIIKKINNNIISFFNEKEEMILSWSEVLNGDFVEFILNGDLINELMFELEDEITSYLLIGKKVELNLEQLSYLGSSGMAMLLSLQKFCEEKEDYEMVLSHIPQTIMDEFIELGFHEILHMKGLEES